MAFLTKSDPSAYDRPFPKVGCGLFFCFEEDDFVVTAGTASDIEIVLNLFSGVTDGDTLSLHGYTFTFVSGTPSNVQEVQIAVLDATATNFYNALLSIPFFIDNYTIDNSTAYQVKVTANEAEFDDNFSFSSTTANADAIIIDPFSTPTQGTDAVVKDNYYVYFSPLDFAKGQPLCASTLATPINVPSSGNPSACFDLQAIVSTQPSIFTLPPSPYSPTATLPNKIGGFDANYLGEYNVRAWGKYQNPNSSENCDLVQTNLIELPPSSQKVMIANFLQNIDDCQENGFNDYSFNPAGNFSQEWITNMTDYGVCQETAIELRFDYPVATIDLIGGAAYIETTLNFTDGTSTVHVWTWDEIQDGVHVAYLSFGDGTGNETVPFVPAGKKLSTVEVRFFHIVMATLFEYLKPFTIHFNNDANSFVKCCDHHKTFYFLGQRGNNDVIVGADIQIDFDAEFFQYCKEQSCCGSDVNGVNVYNMGLVSPALDSTNKVYKAKIEASEDYLEQFLMSPMKWEYDPDNNSVFLIQPMKSSYTIWKKNSRTYIEFDYKRSLIKRHLTL